jgi:hypothetical protein
VKATGPLKVALRPQDPTLLPSTPCQPGHHSSSSHNDAEVFRDANAVETVIDTDGRFIYAGKTGPTIAIFKAESVVAAEIGEGSVAR